MNRGNSFPQATIPNYQKCDNCGKYGHSARNCMSSQSRNPQRSTNVRTAAIEPTSPNQAGTTNSNPENEVTHVPSVIGPESTVKSSSKWRTQLIPLSEPTREGITHKLVDLNGKTRDSLIGLPKGLQPTAQLEILGTLVECLIDSGSQVNLIEEKCLRKILEKAPSHSRLPELHPPAYPACTAANGSLIEFTGAISLPISRGKDQVWIEMQVPNTPLPRPVVLGTNGLVTLRFQVIDTITGENFLRRELESSHRDSLQPSQHD